MFFSTPLRRGVSDGGGMTPACPEGVAPSVRAICPCSGRRNITTRGGYVSVTVDTTTVDNNNVVVAVDDYDNVVVVDDDVVVVHLEVGVFLKLILCFKFQFWNLNLKLFYYYLKNAI